MYTCEPNDTENAIELPLEFIPFGNNLTENDII